MESIARAEHDENVQRKDLSPSELTTILETLDGDGNRCNGVRRPSWFKKAQEILEAARNDPTKQNLVEQMDGHRNPTHAYRKLVVERQKEELEKNPRKLPEGRFNVIVADPPWQFSGNCNLAYPTMSVDEIKNLPIQGIAADDSVLWLWITNHHLQYGFDVIAAWGFRYSTCLTWFKNRPGTGHWLLGQTEHCLLATRGNPLRNQPTHIQTTALIADATQHSRKPEAFYRLAEELCVGSRIELFAREPREGWNSDYGILKA